MENKMALFEDGMRLELLVYEILRELNAPIISSVKRLDSIESYVSDRNKKGVDFIIKGGIEIECKNYTEEYPRGEDFFVGGKRLAYTDNAKYKVFIIPECVLVDTYIDKLRKEGVIIVDSCFKLEKSNYGYEYIRQNIKIHLAIILKCLKV